MNVTVTTDGSEEIDISTEERSGMEAARNSNGRYDSAYSKRLALGDLIDFGKIYLLSLSLYCISKLYLIYCFVYHTGHRNTQPVRTVSNSVFKLTI